MLKLYIKPPKIPYFTCPFHSCTAIYALHYHIDNNMTIYSPEVQRIRLPSVNDIFPHGNAEVHSKPMIVSPVPMSPPGTVHPHGTTVLIPYYGQQQQFMSQPQANFTVNYHYPINHHSMTPIESPINATKQRQHYSTSPSPVNAVYYAQESNSNMARYRVSRQATRQSNAWSYEDDCLLKYLKEVRNLGWREISMHFKNRTANGCQFRWRRIVALAKSSDVSQKIQTHGANPSSTFTSRSNSLESILN